MDCRGIQEKLSDFRDGSLPGNTAKEVSLHLETCAECAEIARSLDAVREGLRRLPPAPAPPELLERIREAAARESIASPSGNGPAAPARSLFSRLKTPLEAAAAILLVVSAYWLWPGAHTPSTVPAPTASLATAPGPAADSSPPAEIPPRPAATPAAASPGPPAAPVRVARTEAPPPLRTAEPATRNEERSIATLPENTPDPKVRNYSLADLPTSPVLRASTRFGRIQPVSGESFPAEENRSAAIGGGPQDEPHGEAAQAARLRPPVPYGRDVTLETAPEDREEAAERIRETARRLGGAVEGTDRVASEGTVAVRVLLPERTAQRFLDELSRIGRIPPEGMPARSVFPAGPDPGTIAYTVRLRAR
jgi:anti-sigma factor RsiW